MKGSVNAILFTFVLILAIDEGVESLLGYVLEGLRATYVAGVGIDLKKRLNF
jgi:hypothetical protein